MKYTLNYNIPKPELTDVFDVLTWHNIFDIVDTITKKANDDVLNFESEEATRVVNEQTRADNEEERSTSELSRISSETARSNAEQVRITSEADRLDSEQARKTSEQARATAETARLASETTRVNNEVSRVSNEGSRNTEFLSWRSFIEGAHLGDMPKSTYDTNGDGVVDHADLADKVPWSGIQNNPITFTPEDVAKKGVANGYAPLDENSQIPIANLPPAATTSLKIVNNITERNALTDKSNRVHVLDATGDATVVSGWAEYIWTGTAWVKTAEKESIDVVLSWTNVTSKPTTFVPSAHNHITQQLSYTIATTTDGQTQITIPDTTFDITKHGLILFRNGIKLSYTEDYTVSGRVITFVTSLVKNASVTTYISIELFKATTIY